MDAEFHLPGWIHAPVIMAGSNNQVFMPFDSTKRP